MIAAQDRSFEIYNKDVNLEEFRITGFYLNI